jgi:hypothetical protein
VTREENITEFNKVKVSHPFDVDIKQGDSFSVVIKLDDNAVQYLEVAKEGTTLKIELDYQECLEKGDITLKAEVTMPQLHGVNLSLSSQCNITGFKSTNPFDVDVSLSSELQGDIDAGDININASNSSLVTLRGSGDNAIIEASLSSQIDLADFTVVDAEVDASTSSTITVNASGNLDAEATNSSHIYYLGAPTLGEINTDNSSSVQSK